MYKPLNIYFLKKLVFDLLIDFMTILCGESVITNLDHQRRWYWQ